MMKGSRVSGFALSRVTLLFTVLMLSACVTVVETPFNKKASEDKAVENYTQLGLGYLQQGRTDLSRQRLRKALSIKEDYAPAHDAMGLLWQTEGELDLAEEAFEKAISLDEDYSLAKHHLGRLYSQLKRYDDAEDYLQEAASNRFYDNRAAAYNDLALNHYRAGKADQAVADYREALRIAPYNVDALVNISTLLFEAQNYGESQKFFNRFDRLVKRQQTRHSAHSLWLGIKLATIALDTKRTIELATELKQNFPDSNEYNQYQQSLADASR